MDIALDYYRIFEAVARHRSFTRAAEALVNSRPSSAAACSCAPAAAWS